MTQLRANKKAHALSGAAALIIAVFSAAVLLFTGCPNANGNKPVTHTVSFSVDGGGAPLRQR